MQKILERLISSNERCRYQKSTEALSSTETSGKAEKINQHGCTHFDGVHNLSHVPIHR